MFSAPSKSLPHLENRLFFFGKESILRRNHFSEGDDDDGHDDDGHDDDDHDDDDHDNDAYSLWIHEEANHNGLDLFQVLFDVWINEEAIDIILVLDFLILVENVYGKIF